jgi:rod shape-determining protein MreD
MATRARMGLTALFALAVSLALTILPLPASVVPLRPDWVPVLLLYWSIMTPGRAGLFTAFFMGLALDVLTGALLGQHALALVIVVYLSERFHLRIRAFPLSQLGGTALILLGTYQFVLFWIDGVAGRTVTGLERLAPVVTSTILLTSVLALLDMRQEDTKTRIEV